MARGSWVDEDARIRTWARPFVRGHLYFAIGSIILVSAFAVFSESTSYALVSLPLLGIGAVLVAYASRKTPRLKELNLQMWVTGAVLIDVGFLGFYFSMREWTSIGLWQVFILVAFIVPIYLVSRASRSSKR